MKILFISYYYHPDLSAGSFRIKAIIDYLSSISKKNNISIDVLCSTPNRYKDYRPNVDKMQTNGINIHRVRVNKHSGGILSQSIAFMIYSLGVIKKTKNKEYDIVFASSSRLMTAALAAYICKKYQKKNPYLYLDIRDIFFDTIDDLFNRFFFIIPKKIINFIEKFTINAASHVNLVSEGFREYFNNKYPLKSFTYYTNGIDDIFMNLPLIKNSNSQIKILYAGNIGEGQGLDKIIPHLLNELPKNYFFSIIGNGGTKKILADKLIALNCKNYEILPPIPQKELIKKYQEADILFLHLNNYKAFFKVLPSKIFEYAATHKPICAGVSGHSKEFLENNVSNCSVFEPCNVKDAKKVILNTSLTSQKRSQFNEKYSRKKISELIVNDILKRYNEFQS